MSFSWMVLFPPVLVLIAACITQKLNQSLLIGLITAALIATKGSPITSGTLLIHRLWNQFANADSLYLYSYLLMISIIVTLISHSGGAKALAKVITSKIRNSRMLETITLLFSQFLFIDDYLSMLTVGYVMRPLADSFKIPRTKLAYLVHSLAGPLVIIVPISSWVAYITGQVSVAGISTANNGTTAILCDPFMAYVKTIPFTFYSLLIIASTWIIVRLGISYGPIYKHEQIAQKTGNVCGGAEPCNTNDNSEKFESNGSLADFLVPIVTLITCVVYGISMLSNTYGSTFIIFCSGLITLIVSFTFSLFRKTLQTKQIPAIFKAGTELMLEAIIMVFLVSTLSVMLRDDLQTGQYLADILLGSMQLWLLPVVFFIVSTVVAVMTGSSWGTIALLLPFAVPMVTSFSGVAIPATIEQLPLLFPILGAILSGAICGDHVSPISETTVMAATSTGTTPVEHAYTQIFYAAPAIISAAVAFVCAGLLHTYSLWINALSSIFIGSSVCIVLLLVLNKVYKK